MCKAKSSDSTNQFYIGAKPCIHQFLHIQFFLFGNSAHKIVHVRLKIDGKGEHGIWRIELALFRFRKIVFSLHDNSFDRAYYTRIQMK